jgi:mannose-6-phosphate isomerase-like protein (cupin superfamily)
VFIESEEARLATGSAKILGRAEGKSGQLGGIGVRFMIDAAESGGGFSLVEHPMPPRALGSPLHRHSREDEYSYVLEGRVGVQLGDQIVYGKVGELIFKPRGQWHAFWNAGDEPARILEIISPGGFEGYFEQAIELFAAAQPPDQAKLAALRDEYGLEMDLTSIPQLIEQQGLRYPASKP